MSERPRQRQPGGRRSAATPRRGRLVVAACTVAVGIAAGGCRTEQIWSGIRVQSDGRIQLVSEEPQCGCLTLANATKFTVRLQAARGGQPLGRVVLEPAQRQSFRFDWAGAYQAAAYVVEVTAENGERLDARRVLRIDDHPAWVYCEEASCEYGDLMMNLADPGR